MKKVPKVLTRMRLSCCWGDNLDEKELNDIVDYIDDLEQQCKKQKEINQKAIEYVEEHRIKNPYHYEFNCFMGSGSTGVACVNTNRNFIGIELDENYFNIAKERINNTVRKD